jgi:Ankyrin repeats (3 copies)
VRALLLHGANKMRSVSGSNPSTQGWRPLHFVAANAGRAGAAAALKLLITEHSIEADCPTNAAAFHSPAWLVAHSCSSDSSIASSSSSGDTTAYTLECLEQLLQLGADLHATGSWSLLCAAASSGNTRVAQFLLDKGLQLDETRAAYLPLQHAARKGHTAMVQLLLSRGASVGAFDNKGISVLRACLEAPRDNAELFKVLVAAGGDPLDVVAEQYSRCVYHVLFLLHLSCCRCRRYNSCLLR